MKKLSEMVAEVLYEGAPVPTPGLDELTHQTHRVEPRPKNKTGDENDFEITERMRREADLRELGLPKD